MCTAVNIALRFVFSQKLLVDRELRYNKKISKNLSSRPGLHMVGKIEHLKKDYVTYVTFQISKFLNEYYFKNLLVKEGLRNHCKKMLIFYFNPFIPNATFLHPLKTLDNLTFFMFSLGR